MGDYVYVQNPSSNGAYSYTYFIGTVSSPDFKSDRPFDDKCSYKVFTKPEFEAYVRGKTFKYLEIAPKDREELEYLCIALKDSVTLLNAKFAPYRDFDLTPLENLKSVEEIDLYWNLKITKLWDISKNVNLKYFFMSEYNRVHDFSVFENSSVETLKIFGCNGLSSFTSKLCVDDFSFVERMPKLKSLHFDIVRTREPEYYLKILAKLTNLEELMTQESFFTFKQNAWLAAHLPNTKGLEAYLYCKSLGTYSIIGRRKPRFLKDEARVEKYAREYAALIEKYKGVDEPPAD